LQQKSTLIIVLTLVLLSATILLVDRYYADSPIWWLVAVPIVGAYVYLRANRDLIRNPTDRQAAPHGDLTTTLTDPETERSFPLSDVTKIEIETTGDGPFDEDLYWIFYLRSGPPVRLAGGVAQGQDIFSVLDMFDGVNFENVIQSAAVVDPALFLIWEKA